MNWWGELTVAGVLSRVKKVQIGVVTKKNPGDLTSI